MVGQSAGSARESDGKVEQPTLHECRHGCASLMTASGVNVKAPWTFMDARTSGSRSTSTASHCRARRTEAAGLLDAFLAATSADGLSRLCRTLPNPD